MYKNIIFILLFICCVDMFCTANFNKSISICDASDDRNLIIECYRIPNIHGKYNFNFCIIYYFFLFTNNIIIIM